MLRMSYDTMEKSHRNMQYVCRQMCWVSTTRFCPVREKKNIAPLISCVSVAKNCKAWCTFLLFTSILCTAHGRTEWERGGGDVSLQRKSEILWVMACMFSTYTCTKPLIRHSHALHLCQQALCFSLSGRFSKFWMTAIFILVSNLPCQGNLASRNRNQAA